MQVIDFDEHNEDTNNNEAKAVKVPTGSNVYLASL